MPALVSTDQIESLLDAAALQDRNARWDGRHIPRHAMLSVLVYGGLRLGEMLALRWRDIDLAAGRLRVVGALDEDGKRKTKTQAGQRFVELLRFSFCARLVEKHFTLDRAGGGPDDSFSLEPQGLAELCRGARVAWESLGHVDYGLKSSERHRRPLYESRFHKARQ